MLQKQVDNLIQHIDEGLALCLSLNLAINGTRFALYREWLEELKSLLTGGLEAFSRKAMDVGIEEADEAATRFLLAILEGGELAAIVPFLSRCLTAGRAEEIRPKLEKMLAGPAYPRDEDDNKNEARNIQFELTMASQFDRSGLSPVLGHNPDLACTVLEDKRIFIQCKRPLSRRRVSRNITIARGQLERDIQATPAARGIVMVSVDKVGELKDKILFRQRGTAPVAERLNSELEHIARRSRKTIERLPSEIIEVQFVYSVPIFEIESQTFNRSHSIYYITRTDPGSDVDLLSDFHAKVRSGLVPYSHLSSE